MFKEHQLPNQPHVKADGSLTWDGYTEAQLLENVKVQSANMKESKADHSNPAQQDDAEGYIGKSLAIALSRVTGNTQPWKYWVKTANGG